MFIHNVANRCPILMNNKLDQPLFRKLRFLSYIIVLVEHTRRGVLLVWWEENIPLRLAYGNSEEITLLTTNSSFERNLWVDSLFISMTGSSLPPFPIKWSYLVTMTPIADPSAADVCSMWAGLSSAGRGGGIQSRGGRGSFSVDTHCREGQPRNDTTSPDEVFGRPNKSNALWVVWVFV